MSRLNQKVAVVTGAGRGMGRAIAERFAAEGACVAVLSITPANVAAVVGAIEAAGGTALAVPCDVSDEAQVRAAVTTVVDTFGRVDILVNNAFDPSVVFSPVAELSGAQLQRNLDMGPFAYLRLMQAFHPYLKASGAGRVINFGSAAGVLGMEGYAPYAMAKEAVRALTRVAAREWAADGITVNTLMPIANTFGSDAPPLPNALNRNGSPEHDIAPVALFLASEDSRFITGSSLSADGGMTIDSGR